MLRRFNSLIKGPKGQISDDDLNSELHVSLRPALSVDSSLSQHHYHVNPLQQFARARDESSSRAARRGPSENGQTSQPGEEPARQGFVIARVPEEKSWKEGYEHGMTINNPLQDSPEKLPPRGDSNGAASAQPPAATRVLRTSSGSVNLNSRLASARSTDLHSVIDVPDAQAGSGVDLETVRRSVFTIGPGRTISSWSTDSAAEHCRICQQSTEEPLIDLGCLCRGEMAKSHKSCIEMWFKNKGTNKCEVCQHVATNIAAPPTTPAPHFWVWRLGGPYGAAQAGQAAQPAGGRSRVGFQGGPLVNRPVLLMIIRKHPLIPVMWLGLLAFMTYLFVDAINTSTIGYAAMPIGFLFVHPLWAALAILVAGLLFNALISVFLGASAWPVNIIMGVLVVLGLGTAVRLVLEYMHERNMQRRIQLLELDPVPEDPAEGSESPGRPTNTQSGPSAV